MGVGSYKFKLIGGAMEALLDAAMSPEYRKVFSMDLSVYCMWIKHEYESVANSILPFVAVDCVSYSAWDMQLDKFHDGLNFLQNQFLKGWAGAAAGATSMPEKRVFIDEFGVPTRHKNGDPRYSLEEQSRVNAGILADAVAWGVPYAFHWQIYDNGTCANHLDRGYSLQLRDETYTPFYHTMVGVLKRLEGLSVHAGKAVETMYNAAQRAVAMVRLQARQQLKVMEPRKREKAVDAMQEREYSVGEVIVTQDAPGEELYVVAAGCITVLRKAKGEGGAEELQEKPVKREPPLQPPRAHQLDVLRKGDAFNDLATLMLLDVLRKGDAFGDLALMTGEPHCATYRVAPIIAAAAAVALPVPLPPVPPRAPPRRSTQGGGGGAQLLVMARGPFEFFMDAGFSAASGQGPRTPRWQGAPDPAMSKDMAVRRSIIGAHNKASGIEGRAPSAAASRRGSMLQPGADAHSAAKDMHARARLAMLNMVPVFEPLPAEQREQVASALVEMSFRPGAYICEQGKPGNSFYIIVEGVCKVTVHDPSVPGQQREVTKLHASDFFGEVALIEKSMRTASVVAETVVRCLSLTRRHFETHLSGIKTVVRCLSFTRRHFETHLSGIKATLMEHSATKQLMAGEGNDDDANDLFHPIEEEGGTAAKKASKPSTARRQSMRSFQGIAMHVLKLQNRKQGTFARHPPYIEQHRGAAQHQRAPSAAAPEDDDAPRQRLSTNARRKASQDAMDCGPGAWLTKRVAYAHSADVYQQLLAELVDHPANLPEHSKIMAEVLHKSVGEWAHAVELLRATVTSALSKRHSHVTEGEVAAVSAVLRGEVAAVSAVLRVRPALRHNKRHSHVTEGEGAAVLAVLRMRPALRRKYAKGWPDYQWLDLCRHMQLEQVESMETIFAAESQGSKAYLVLTGLVRLLERVVDDSTGTARLVYHSDLCPGDVLGDGVLDGVRTRHHTAVAVSRATLLSVDVEDYLRVRDHGVSLLSVDDKFHFLKQVPLLKGMEMYRIYRIALLARLEEYPKDTWIVRSGEASRGLFFIYSGTAEVTQSKEGEAGAAAPAAAAAAATTAATRAAAAAAAAGDDSDDGTDAEERAMHAVRGRRRVLAILEAGEHLGESGLLQAASVGGWGGGAAAAAAGGGGGGAGTAAGGKREPITESFSVVARTTVQALVLRARHYAIIDANTLELVRSAHAVRALWRRARKKEAHRARGVVRAARRRLREQARALREGGAADADGTAAAAAAADDDASVFSLGGKTTHDGKTHWDVSGALLDADEWSLDDAASAACRTLESYMSSPRGCALPSIGSSQPYKAHHHPDMHGLRGLALLCPKTRATGAAAAAPPVLPAINTRNTPRGQKMAPLLTKRKAVSPPPVHLSKLGKALCR
ncbi:hypothetical protein JKP88DRAFT_300798 [Tribonema minus]|uniref:Cyclic nucleotide-binding domain-containing protein n=1 Tax=Tribonema minus TaxID=303371 RepID=A0A835Z9P8_9STRA|nr:hypothetical protein JKP88DRAFT_300798 [Tribonema minus]